MDRPPSLSSDVLARCFLASNGELGVRLEDASAFLDACAADGMELLGWELWLADHVAGAEGPCPASGRWCGLIPVRGQSLLCVFGGEGDLAATRAQLAGLDIEELEPRWRDYARINFTLAG